MNLAKDIETALETLEALYFFGQGLDNASGEHLEKVLGIYRVLLPQGHAEFLVDIRRDIAMVREHFGALAPDELYVQLLAARV